MNSRLVRWRSILAGEKKLARPRVAFPSSVSHSEPQYLEKVESRYHRSVFRLSHKMQLRGHIKGPKGEVQDESPGSSCLEQHMPLLGHDAIFSAQVVVATHQSISCENLPVSVVFSCLSRLNSHHRRFC